MPYYFNSRSKTKHSKNQKADNLFIFVGSTQLYGSRNFPKYVDKLRCYRIICQCAVEVTVPSRECKYENNKVNMQIRHLPMSRSSILFHTWRVNMPTWFQNWVITFILNWGLRWWSTTMITSNRQAPLPRLWIWWRLVARSRKICACFFHSSPTTPVLCVAWGNH